MGFKAIVKFEVEVEHGRKENRDFLIEGDDKNAKVSLEMMDGSTESATFCIIGEEIISTEHEESVFNLALAIFLATKSNMDNKLNGFAEVVMLEPGETEVNDDLLAIGMTSIFSEAVEVS